MDNRAGFTVTPAIYTTPDGQEHLSYDHADVTDHRNKMAAIEHHNGTERQYFQQDHTGRIEHQYDFGEAGELFDPGREQDLANASQQSAEYNQYVEETYGDPNQDIEPFSEQFEQVVFNELGGQENYAALMDWASQHVDDEFIQDFDKAIENQDADRYLKMLTALVRFYEEQE